MTTALTAVTYHDRKPAINVKVHVPGLAFWPDAFDAFDVDAQEIGRTTASDLIDVAYDTVQQEFWEGARATAEGTPLGQVYQDGRSGGWLVFDTDPSDGGDVDVDPEWLAAYHGMVLYAESFIADAPARVAALALQLAMDELGAAPAARMFAFERENA